MLGSIAIQLLRSMSSSARPDFIQGWDDFQKTVEGMEE
jgi:hypothetical protein